MEKKRYDVESDLFGKTHSPQIIPFSHLERKRERQSLFSPFTSIYTSWCPLLPSINAASDNANFPNPLPTHTSQFISLSTHTAWTHQLPKCWPPYLLLLLMIPPSCCLLRTQRQMPCSCYSSPHQGREAKTRGRIGFRLRRETELLPF